MCNNHVCEKQPLFNTRAVTDPSEKAMIWSRFMLAGYTPADYMLMHYTSGKGYAFKHRDTREYIYIQ